ncbi:hypothetical protein Q1695_000601 [Nippostrongylus brasiliensis]|nr:hypothetical protein Q1695_000601 [Nippostrongylus brasiliensis]
MTSTYNRDVLGEMVMELQCLLQTENVVPFLCSRCDDLVNMTEKFFAGGLSEEEYSMAADHLKIEESALKKILLQLVRVVANLASIDVKVESVLDNLPVRSFLEEDVMIIVRSCVESASKYPEKISSLVKHHLHDSVNGSYLDSSMRFDRNIAQRSLLDTDGPRHATFVWRLQLKGREDVMLRVSLATLTHLSKQLDAISAEMNKSRHAHLQSSFHRF